MSGVTISRSTDVSEPDLRRSAASWVRLVVSSTNGSGEAFPTSDTAGKCRALIEVALLMQHDNVGA